MHDPLPREPLPDPSPTVVIQDAVLAIATGLDTVAVTNALDVVAKQKAARRRLAAALETDPGLLNSGRPEGPPTVERLIRELQRRGAAGLVLPGCARCHKQYRLVGTIGLQRICASCLNKRSATPCTACGRTLPAARRDRAGSPYCVNCPPVGGGDPADLVWRVLAHVEHGLSRQQVDDALHVAAKVPGRQWKLAWAIEDSPNLLTGTGCENVDVPAEVLNFTSALVAQGAHGIAAARCSICGEAKPLKRSHEGKRCCSECYRTARSTVCSRCGATRQVAARTLAGEPLCDTCRKADPINHDPCTNCGRLGLIIRTDRDERLCRRCYRGPIAICAICGQTRPCSFADTDAPRCEACYDRTRAPQQCSRCARIRVVQRRLPDGQPLCVTCCRVPETCMGCGQSAFVQGRARNGEAFCARCYARHPDARRNCVQCGVLDRLHHHGLCNGCALNRIIDTLLGDDSGFVRPEVRPVAECLCRASHRRMLKWLRSPRPQAVLRALGAATGPVTHEVLDGLAPFATVRHLRCALVAEGVLPSRDERIARLEAWVVRISATVQDPVARQALRGFARWHHLCRLRRQAERRPIGSGAAQVVREDLRATSKFLAWLDRNGTTLAACTQADVDRWVSEGGPSAYRARMFLSWAVKHQYASNVVISAPRPSESVQVIEQDVRWSLVKRLLHDAELEVSTRVAGLLVLLFGQTVTRVAGLRTDDVISEGDVVKLKLGSVPVELPPPLDGLVLLLVSKRDGHSVLGRSKDHPWLIPGSGAGQPIGATQLGARLNRLGMQARPARNTTMMDLAAELPAVALNRLLGIHISSATRWNRDAGGLQASYAAELVRRRREAADQG